MIKLIKISLIFHTFLRNAGEVSRRKGVSETRKQAAMIKKPFFFWPAPPAGTATKIVRSKRYIRHLKAIVRRMYGISLCLVCIFFSLKNHYFGGPPTRVGVKFNLIFRLEFLREQNALRSKRLRRRGGVRCSSHLLRFLLSLLPVCSGD